MIRMIRLIFWTLVYKGWVDLARKQVDGELSRGLTNKED